jgi:armadillo repeat-containing protein 8
MNAGLRLNALWALKHLVYSVPPALKKQCLDELEPGWLVRLICDDTEDDALISARANMERQDDQAMDEDIDMQQSDEAKGWQFGHGGQDSARGRTPQMEARLARYRESESNPVRKARNDDLAIQEQGLHFIRNLITSGRSADMDRTMEAETTEMVNVLFSSLGQDRLFEILASKLRARVLRPLSRRSTSGGGRDSGSSTSSASRVLYPQSRIIEAVVYILVHISASAPRYRQVVIAQTTLLKLLVNHFNSKDKEVRVALCHLVANLTWADSPDDMAQAAHRANELRRLGFVKHLETLEKEDPEFNVQERARHALFQVRQHDG